MEISKKQIIGIREFIINYYNLQCNWRGKLSHKRMEEFLLQKGKIVNKINFLKIGNEDILRGTCIFVRDEIGQVIPYRNPIRNICFIDIKKEASNLEAVRLNLLKEQGLTYDEYGNIITIEEQKAILERQRSLLEEIENNMIMGALDDYYERKSLTNRQKVKRNYKGSGR